MFSFYEKKFLKLYDVTNFDRYLNFILHLRNHLDSMLIMHQSKSENSDRLY
jgi:hypothetical protein